MHFRLCPWGWRQGVAPPKALHIAATRRGNPSFVIVALAVAVAISVPVANSVAVADSVAVAVTVAIAVAVTIAHRCCRCRRPLPLWLPSTIPAAIFVALPSAIAVAVALAIGHCRLHHRWLSQLPLPSAITVTMLLAISESCCLGAARIVFNQLKQRMLTLFLFCLDSGRRIDQSRMTD
jgi:small-conductance mechanosensitive channel